MEFFLHPWYMVAGGALVSAPILIHLINRMRFKRIRWAAMEFLLKSQKRNRRRLIIEQLILLLLRILLVLLAAFLVARFVGAAWGQSEGRTHLILLDNTPSMGDRWAEKGQVQTSFDLAKEQIRELIKNAGQAPSPQQVEIRLLSEPDTVIFNQRLSNRSLDELNNVLSSLEPVFVHVDPIVAIEKGQNVLNDVKVGQKVLHFVSDFRETDWLTGAGVPKLNEAIERLLNDRINLSLVDVAVPGRNRTRNLVQNPDNLAIVDFRAETRMAAEGVPVEFTVTVANFGSSNAKSFLNVKVDGHEDFNGAHDIDQLEPGRTRTVTFPLTFTKKKAAQESSDKDTPEERERKRRLDREFVHVTAEIKDEGAGLSTDNLRDLVIEVRKKVPTLVVDGGGPESRSSGGDLFHLETAFSAAKSYEIERRRVDELAKTNLDLYPSIIFLNVPEIKETKVLERLQQYVERGGSIAYFLGDKVRPAFYNDVLFKKYAGLFPLLIADRPIDAVDPTGVLSEEERQEKRRERLQLDEQPKIMFKDPNDPLVASLAPWSPAFRYLSIDRYHPARPRLQWDPNQSPEVKVPVMLPNTRSIDDYKRRAQQLGDEAVTLTKDLAAAEPETFEKYVAVVERNRKDLATALASPYLFNLAKVLDALLNDPGARDDAARPDMKTLWAHPKLKALKTQIEEFRETVLYGDPLVVTRPHGKGRVVAILTSAGTAEKWNNWGGGSFASWSYPVFMMDLQRYLISEGDDLNRKVGEELTFQLDASRYLPKVKRRFQPQPPPGGEGRAGPPPEQDQGEQRLPMSKNVLTFQFADASKPGVYTFEFFPTPTAGGVPQTETRSYAFNLDAQAESNLKRVVKEKLERPRNTSSSRAGAVRLQVPEDGFEDLKEKQPDASESPWLYLFFLVILVVEQALAVHLSFHLRGNEAAPAVAGTRTQPAAAA